MTTIEVTVGKPRQPRTRLLSIALTVLFVAWVMGWLWWLAAAAAVLGAVVVGLQWYARHLGQLAAIAARADQQHAWVLAGDPRGTYGEFKLPTEGNRETRQSASNPCIGPAT